MFVQFSQGFGPGCLRFSDRSIEVSLSLGLTVATQPALALDQADVFLSSVQVPQFKLVAALAGHPIEATMRRERSGPSPSEARALQSLMAEQARGAAGAENTVADGPNASRIFIYYGGSGRSGPRALPSRWSRLRRAGPPLRGRAWSYRGVIHHGLQCLLRSYAPAFAASILRAEPCGVH